MCGHGGCFLCRLVGPSSSAVCGEWCWYVSGHGCGFLYTLVVSLLLCVAFCIHWFGFLYTLDVPVSCIGCCGQSFVV